MIEIQELCKYYGQRRAIGPLSARIEKGEVIGLLGLNGAGKTTTLRVLACDLLPSSGTVKVGGIDVVERPEEVAALIRRALKVIPPERLIVSTDCGFGRQGMSRLHAFYKMVSLVRGTNIVRRELGLPEADVLAADPQGSLIG